MGKSVTLFTNSLAVCLMLAVPISSHHATAQDKDQPSEQFTVYNDGDMLLVPVTIKGKTYQFALDTGSSHTVYDTILLDMPINNSRASTPAGKMPVQLFKAPKSMLGKFSLTSHVVPGLDLRRLRQAAGHEIYGVIGMDFLAHFILDIDFDNGTLTLSRSCATPPTPAMPMYFENGLPHILCEVGGWGQVGFLIDTGYVSWNAAASVRSALFAILRERRLVRPVTTVNSETAAGNMLGQLGILSSLTLGGHDHKPVLVDTTEYEDKISLNLLSRYNMVCNFPDRQIYLSPRKHDRRTPQNDIHCLNPNEISFENSGLDILSIDGRIAVGSVAKGSPAEKADIKPNDILVNINGKEVKDLRLYSIRGILTMKDKHIPLVIQRGSKLKEVNVHLGDWDE